MVATIASESTVDLGGSLIRDGVTNVGELTNPDGSAKGKFGCCFK
jgi:hypothetical protein